MQHNQIVLDFSSFTLEVELFDTPIAARFREHLPYQVHLMQWGNELARIWVKTLRFRRFPQAASPIPGRAIMCAFFSGKPLPGMWSISGRLKKTSGKFC